MASFLVLVLALGSLAAGSNASLSSLLTLFGQQPAESPLRVTHSGEKLTEWLVDLGPQSYQGSSGPLLVNPEPSVSSSPNITHSAGYFRLNGTHDTRMFYFYFSQRVSDAEGSSNGHGVGTADDAPLVLWMTGGPGCSSEVALFFENGPFTINNDNETLSWNPYGWDLASHIIYVDQPVNTGFSYSKDPRDVRHDEKGVSHDVYEFLQAFLEAHPEHRHRPFFVTGESYGGHYVPAVAHRVMKENDAGLRARINLQGLAVGNGLTHPVQQYGAYADFALLNKLITPQQHKVLHKAYLPCKLATKSCGEEGFVSCYVAFYICESYFSTVFLSSGSGNLNPYDIREDCAMGGLCYDMSAADKFLAQPAVRKALGVPEFVQWKDCSQGVYLAMIKDFMRDLEPQVTDLVNSGIRTLVYAGDKDYICNWLGNWRWVRDMGWSGHDDFIAASRLPFKASSNSSAWGEAVEAGALSFLRVYDAGHMVPMNKPEAALEMIRRFTRDVPLGDKASQGKAIKHWARAEREAAEGELKTLRLGGPAPVPAGDWKGLAGMFLGGDVGSAGQALSVDVVEGELKRVKGQKEEKDDEEESDKDKEDSRKKDDDDDDDDDDEKEHKEAKKEHEGEGGESEENRHKSEKHHHNHRHSHGRKDDDDKDDDDDDKEEEKHVRWLGGKKVRGGHEAKGVARERVQEWMRTMGLGHVGVQEYERRVGSADQPRAHHGEGPKGRKVKCHHKQHKGLAQDEGPMGMWKKWVKKAHKCLFGAGHKGEEEKDARLGEGRDESD